MDFGTVEKKEQTEQADHTTQTVEQADQKLVLLTPSELKGNARMKDESFDDYKSRRKVENLSTKHYLRGRVVPFGYA